MFNGVGRAFLIGKCAIPFKTIMEKHDNRFFVPSHGALFRFWLDEWSDKGCQFRIFALTQHSQAQSKSVGTEGGTHQLAHLFGGIHECNRCSRGGGPGTTQNAIFSSWAISTVRTAQSEDPIRLDECREVWKQRLPLKVAIFAWIFARQRVLTRVRHRLLVSAGSALCMLCGEQEEDCEHLFFPFKTIIRFWATIPRRRRGYEAERGRRFAVI